jgi:hypothetical protein
MQLHVDHGSIESAIAELKRVDPVDLDRLEIALQICRCQINIAERVRRHKPRSALRRELRQWRTRELGAAVD